MVQGLGFRSETPKLRHLSSRSPTAVPGYGMPGRIWSSGPYRVLVKGFRV